MMLPVIGPGRDDARSPGRRRVGRTLTTRAVLVTCLVALISVLVTLVVSVPLAARTADRQAREALAAQANLAAQVLRPRIDRGRSTDEERIIQQLRRQRIDAYLIRAGQPDRSGLPQATVQRIAAGHNFSGRRLVAGRPSLIEGRALPGGSGVVLVRPLVSGLWLRIVAGLWLPLLAGLVAGVVAGILLARRLARPIRNAATAAARLRSGERDVRLPVEPPQEAADLAYALNDLATALATSEGRQREFLLSVSHELRTPLTSIRGYAEAIADGVVGPDEAQRAGRTMLGEAEHLDRLVSDLLALARLEAADFALEPLPVELGGLLRAVAQTWAPRCAAAGVELRAELPPTPVAVWTDPGRIRQVVDGLLENALRVVPPGAPVVVAARAASGADAGPAPRNGGGIVQVRDGGPGFTDDDLAVAFERGALHQRYRGVRKVGSGLGLALAAGLVRRLGGAISAGHAPEGGASFTVWLPPPP
ncbi:cell wall metabolism sensor histidine kinase WalK [Plantactinospora sp. KBS50]|uniref:sensor histidine kinase n=1 Tax=Plantactinospora sp. KBS50 TaxID=2024580 RepID=UPI000BAAB971|nr:HAMP domain-containing sensor histidine kinase [Plantactinospora sp. KBS50]ASW58091.1 two-component sensor histidine kinase [Plantactinospora sp. KBS50]